MQHWRRKIKNAAILKHLILEVLQININTEATAIKVPNQFIPLKE